MRKYKSEDIHLAMHIGVLSELRYSGILDETSSEELDTIVDEIFETIGSPEGLVKKFQRQLHEVDSLDKMMDGERK